MPAPAGLFRGLCTGWMPLHQGNGWRGGRLERDTVAQDVTVLVPIDYFSLRNKHLFLSRSHGKAPATAAEVLLEHRGITLSSVPEALGFRPLPQVH
jgi:hypothetical protein